MLGTPPLEAILGSGLANTNHDAVRAFIRQACGQGLSLLLISPGSKVPADMRTVRTRNADDRAAQEAARDAGRGDWAKVKSASGLALASTDAKVVLKYLDEYIRVFSTWADLDGNTLADPPTPKAIKEAAVTMVTPVEVNLAAEVGGSGLVVVDCDTAAQMRRFLEWTQAPADLPPTVRTPGVFKTDAGSDAVSGEWVHKDGGHFYFTVPEGMTLPTNLGAITMSGDDGFAVLWHRRYVLIPPSTRPEGAYTLTGRIYGLDVIEPLRALIVEAGTKRAERQQQAAENRGEGGSMADAIDAWAEATPWSEVLEPLGWTPASRVDNCGCEVWTAGAGHASAKSATAHDSGCSLGRYTEVNSPLHVWTDNPGEPLSSYISEHGTQTLSKLQVVALTRFGGNVGKAMDALGLTPPPPTIDAVAGVDNANVTAAAGVDTANMDRPIWGETAPAAQSMPSAPAAAADLPTAQPGMVTATCACGAVVGINGTDTTVATDAEGALWHDDGKGGHLVASIDPGPPLVIGTDVAVGASVPAVDPFVGVGEQQATQVPGAPHVPTADAPFADEVDPPDPDVLNSQQFGVPVIAPFSHWRDMPPPEYIIDGLIENGGLSCIIGPPGVGKSSVALDMACHIATGKSWQGRRTLKTKVLYMPGEGLSGAVQRIWAWEEAHKIEVGNNLLLSNSIIKLGASNEAWQEVGNFIIRQGIGFIIFDTFARMALSVEENSATEVGKAVERFDQIRRHANTGVLIVHHTGKHSESARGSSALNGALDSELLVRNGNWDTAQIVDAHGHLPGKPIELDTTKQKNAEQLAEVIPMLMVNWESRKAPIITGPGGSVDPMQGEIVLARPVPEVVVETAIRIYQLVQRYPEQGLSRADLVSFLEPDSYTAGRADVAKAWKQKVSESVDRALRYDLVQTLTGTASGQRYIPSAGTPEQARTLYAAENITGD